MYSAHDVLWSMEYGKWYKGQLWIIKIWLIHNNLNEIEMKIMRFHYEFVSFHFILIFVSRHLVSGANQSMFIHSLCSNRTIYTFVLFPKDIKMDDTWVRIINLIIAYSCDVLFSLIRIWKSKCVSLKLSIYTIVILSLLISLHRVM